MTSGSGSVDESAITGESVPLHKSVDSQVYAGSVCQNGYFELRAEALATESMLQQIFDLLERAQAQKTKSQAMLDRFVVYYTPLVILTMVAYIAVCIGTDADDNKECFKTGFVLLLLACPCALVAAAPTPVAFGTTAAVKSGVVVKSPQAFEDMASIDTVAFDKTGTLTNGTFELIDSAPLSEYTGRAVKMDEGMSQRFLPHACVRPDLTSVSEPAVCASRVQKGVVLMCISFPMWTDIDTRPPGWHCFHCQMTCGSSSWLCSQNRPIPLRRHW